MNICASYWGNKNGGKKKHLAHVASLFIISLLYLHQKKKKTTDILYIDFHTANWVGLINQGF